MAQVSQGKLPNITVNNKNVLSVILAHCGSFWMGMSYLHSD
jgi:hypothetical protein